MNPNGFVAAVPMRKSLYYTYIIFANAHFIEHFLLTLGRTIYLSNTVMSVPTSYLIFR